MTINHQFINDAKVSYLGSLDNDTLLLMIGRRNYNKKSNTIDSLISSLHSPELSVAWYESKSAITGKFLDDNYLRLTESKLGELLRRNTITEAITRKAIKALILLTHPRHWDYFSSATRSHTKQAERLRLVLHAIGKDKRIYVVSHSAGGILTSLVNDESAIRKSICFGYPFKHPNKEHEPARVRQLEHLKKPFLIIQGRQDAYGGTDVLERYKMSPSVSMLFIESDHDYEQIGPESLDEITLEIRKFIGI